jgi:hypothetical protein
VRAGKRQAEIVAALEGGEILYFEGGIWRLGPEGGMRRSVLGSSCEGLVKRGILVLDKAEDHPAYWGGRCEWYVLSERR